MSVAPQIMPEPAKRRNTDADERQRLDQELRALVAEVARTGDLKDSVERVLEQLDAMPHLNAYFREQAAGNMVYDARSRLRERMVGQSAWTIPERAATMSEARLNARISMYDWPLPGCDLRLGDATASDLETAAAYHDGRAQGEIQRATAYRQIAGMLKKTRKPNVRAGVPEARLAEVMRGAQ